MVKINMERINIITDNLKNKILKFLYHDEIYNTILIDLIQNNINDIGELYINKTQERITDILHIKNDGNSYLTNFSYTNKIGLKDIAFKINELNYKRILLSGKMADVKDIIRILGYKRNITPNIFYNLNQDKYKNINKRYKTKVRLANFRDKDLEIIKKFTVSFLEAETEEEIKSVTNNEKILEKVKMGVYILYYENKPIGMARFIGKTRKFAEITSVYIDKDYRNKGLGKELIGHMIDTAIREYKNPILVTSVLNKSAMKTYESMGFERQLDYAYEFLT
ncbi:GNAT family N-acetyltransferase [Senegalia massiliensis]|uniref:GNAT family N-acetyltransferase n=2 Tax=Senegalia massiliensis TaxID=1720316 RepID=A0A845QRY1_9CLOT|nr:GNAT family N-acetyltransferase [Senegalia massiliensis]